MDAECCCGNEPVRDGIPDASIGRGTGIALVHATIEVDLCGHATLASAHVLWCEIAVKHEAL
jgi:hypothetical protein